MNPKQPQHPPSISALLAGFTLFFCLFPPPAAHRLAAEEGAAQPGLLDLTSGLQEEDYRIPLRGNWLFLDGRLAEKGDPSLQPETPIPEEARPIPVPGPWHPEKTYGFGTYYLTLRLPRRTPPPALSLGNTTNAYRLFLNGREVSAMGNPGPSREAEAPCWGTNLIPLDQIPETQPGEGPRTVRLALAFSNWQDGHGGMTAAPILEPLPSAVKNRQIRYLLDAFLLGALIIMGLYHILLYLHRRADRTPLYFGFLLILLGLRTMVTGGHLIREILPSLSWVLHTKISFLTFTLPVILFLNFIDHLFPGRIPRRIRNILITIAGLYSAWILLAPMPLYHPLLLWFQLLTIGLALTVLYVLFHALRCREVGAGYFLAGFAVLFLALLADIAAIYGFVPSLNLVPLGLLVFVFFQSLVITRKLTRALTDSERYTRRLSQLNSRMERFVPREFLAYLQKDDITDVRLGDHIRAEMTIMFLKIQNLPDLTREQDPSEAFDFLNDFLSHTGPLVRSRGGFIDKYFGNGFMALFPRSNQDALSAALDIRQALSRYNQSRAGTEVRVGIGLHRGRLMLGTIGENERMDGTVIADSVNLASRLTGLTAKHAIDIAVSQACVPAGSLDSGEALIRYHYLGDEQVKGKKRSVEVYSILPAPPQEAPAP